MAKLSAGIVLYRSVGDRRDDLEILAVHPGGPFWAKKDDGAWSIPKGEYGPDEEAVAVARREFVEELGQPLPDGELIPLGEVRQSGGKRVTAWALELPPRSSFDVGAMVSNTFEMEWPPRSGQRQTFPEVDRAEWFGVDLARRKLVAAQVDFVDELIRCWRA